MYAKINQKTSNFLQTKRAAYKKVDSIFSYNFCYILNKTWMIAAVVAGGHTVVAIGKTMSGRVGVCKISSTRDGTMAKGEAGHY